MVHGRVDRQVGEVQSADRVVVQLELVAQGAGPVVALQPQAVALLQRSVALQEAWVVSPLS